MNICVAGASGALGRKPARQPERKRKLPRQADTAQLGSARMSRLGGSVSGGTASRLSWGRSVLPPGSAISCRHEGPIEYKDSGMRE